ncbi:putative transporter subunit: membrane component of ABC superfamily [Escherichia coli]|uniref:Inner membrane transport permease YhhJ n=1 Tax=Escherichia coli TaxID=562 RepID=A0A2X3LLM7_ECOLX|nr:putative transporter subunit: membrane component of ABC superfamily [Escherichia coli]
MRHLRNIFNLGIKELRSLLGDKAMLTLIVFSFTVSVYSSATVTPGSLNLAPIAIADMDQSQLSNRIVNSFYRPWFLPPEMITADEMDAGLDAGRYTFAINIPPNFQRDVLAGRQPDIQVNVDATRMSQAFTGNGYIQNIINGEVNSFVARYRDNSEPLVSLETRMRFNPNLDPAWFGGVMAIINNITMLAIVLTGSALIREREHGTVEHLLVMPITPFEIMMAKIWSMGLVVLVVSGLSLVLMVKGVLGVPIEGSIPLFMLGRGAQSVCHHVNRHFYGDDSAFNAATGAAGDSGAATVANAFWCCYRCKCFLVDPRRAKVCRRWCRTLC